MGPRLAAAQGGMPGACHVLDAKFEPGVRAVLLYEQAGRLLRGDLVPEGGLASADPARMVEPGVLVSPFPHDPELPSLPSVMDPACLGHAMARALSEAGAGPMGRVPRSRMRLLRYRPGKRVTLLVAQGPQASDSLISDKPKPNIIDKHDWLPNQSRHFQNVRCIECHARAADSLLVPHNIQPKEKAVKMCVECHSKNSLLLESLYHYNRSKINATSLGFENEIILNSSYVIGANRNSYLNIISLIIFALVLGGILMHVTFRIVKRKKS
jgi:hypothetical protein